MEYPQNISNEELVSLPSAHCKGEIYVIDSSEHDLAADFLANCTVLGFDTETRPSFKKGVVYPLSLLQLTGGNKTFLFRVDRIKLSNKIVKLFRNKNIVKVGVDINGDIKKLQEIAMFKPAGFVDLQKFAPNYGIAEKSLRKLSAIVLGYKISKAQRLSNWAAKVLTQQQIGYAATDSYISREIYLKLLDSKPSPLINIENKNPNN